MSKMKLRDVDGMQEEEDRVVRPELNLEQWVSIFTPSQSRKSKHERRTIEHTTSMPNGDKVTDSVIVDFCGLGTLTAKDQRVLYALFQHWSEQGRPLGHCQYSTYRLAQILKLKWGGGNQEVILDSLRKLHAVTITFKQCFHDAETNDVYRDEKPLHILADLDINTRDRQEDGSYKPLESGGSYVFHPRILNNLVRNYTRPVLLDVVLSFKSDTAQLLYALADRQLAAKADYNITTARLFKELGLTGKDYQYPSARKRLLAKPLAELAGKALSAGGAISAAMLEPTKDKTDYKVVFKKRARALAAAPPPKQEAHKEEQQENELAQRLRVELHIGAKQALQCAEQHQARAQNILAAKEFFAGWQNKTGGFWFLAITEGYELPPAYAAQCEVAAAQAKSKDRKARIAACPFCRDTDLPGSRRVFSARHPRGAWKECTHDPEIENKFSVSA